MQVKGGRPRSSSGERLRVMGENPALEWNNYDPTQDSKNTDVILHPFIARLWISISYAFLVFLFFLQTTVVVVNLLGQGLDGIRVCLML